MVAYLFELSYTLIIIGIVFYCLKQSTTQVYLSKKSILHWIVFGFAVNFYGLSWLYTVYPLPWMREGLLQLIAITTLHLILSLFTALPYGILAFHLHPKIRIHMKPFIFASLLTLAEIFRALTLSLLYYKQGTSTLGLHFTAGTIGNALSTTPFIEYAYFGGTFALTFTFGYLLYIFHSKKNIHLYWKHAIASVVLLLCVHFFIPTTLPEKSIAIGIVTTDFPIVEKITVEDYANSAAHNEEITHAMTLSFASSSKNGNPLFILYPEDTRYIATITPTHKTDLLIKLPNTSFVDGNAFKANNKNYDVSLIYQHQKTELTMQGKEFLLPFNEYVPSFFSALLRLFINSSDMDAYSALHTYTPLHSKKTREVSGVTIGTLICSEILSYDELSKLKKEHPDVIFFQSHLQVFHNNPWFVMHERSFVKVAAAQLRTTLISSVSGAPSYVISPYGKILLAIPSGFATSTYNVRR